MRGTQNTLVDNKTLWDKALVEIEMSVSKANFSTWFKNTFIVKDDGGVIYLAVPNEFVKDWLKNKYHKFILKSLRESSDSVRSVEYIISQEMPKPVAQKETRNNTALNNDELPLQDLYINKEDNLNPRYTFEELIIGSFNELVYAASQAVVKNPGASYNPLFIYGNTGLGKTHIAQAIGNHVKSAFPDKKVHYMTSEKFAVDYVNSLQTNRTNIFKEKYRKYDVIIMDDIQFIAGKEKTQEELFHLFNSMYETNRQIIFSSDVHPNHIPGLEDRLKSRFSAGMIVNVDMPEYESRMAIIEHKSRINNFELDPKISEYIATTLQCNIRELEGIINSIICHCRLKNRSITLNEAKSFVKNTVKQKKTLSVKDVVSIVSQFYNIEEASIYEKTRRKEIVKPRQIVMYLLREDMNISFPTIGEKLGGRDHTTVIHSCDKVKNDLKLNNSLVQEVEQLRAMFHT